MRRKPRIWTKHSATGGSVMMKRALLIVVIGCLPALGQTADGFSLQAVHGKIVVEGGGAPTMKSDQFSIFFSLAKCAPQRKIHSALSIQPYADCLLRPVRSMIG